MESAQEEIVDIHVVRRLHRGSLRFNRVHLPRDGRDHEFRDVVLNLEDIAQVPIIPLGPDMLARIGLDELSGNTNPIVDGMGRLGCEIVDLDYFTSVADARRAMGPDQVLLGNIDPVRTLRNSSPPEVVAAIQRCHRQAGERYIVGAGCEVPRDTRLENFRAMTGYVG